MEIKTKKKNIPDNGHRVSGKKGEGPFKSDPELAKKAGKASVESRRRKADLRKAMNIIMQMPAQGKVKDLLKQFGYSDEDDMSNASALAATLYSMALNGDLKAAEMVMQYFFQASEDDRKTKESDARISAMEKNGVDVSVNSGDDDDGGVVIYLPKIEEEEDESGEEKGE